MTFLINIQSWFIVKT